MHPHLYYIPLLILAGAIFLFVMFRRSRRARLEDRAAPTDPRHLARDDDPARRRALAKGPEN